MAAHESTCCSGCSGIRRMIDQITRVLEIYGWMLDAYVVDFFLDNVWLKIPKSWADFLDETTPEALGKWILNESEKKQVWPLSLLALRKFIEIVEIPRDHRKQSNLKCSSSVDLRKTIQTLEDEKKFNQRQEFNNLFTKHVKKKKRYEIDVLSQKAANSANDANCQCIVDVGAGMGHLARVLAFRHNLCVICVEQNQELSKTARKWDDQLLMSLAKRVPDLYENKPQHVSLQIGVSKTAREQLANQLTEIFTEKFNDTSGFGLIGLHPCGDLATTLLRFYAAEEKARFICIVGCCYMKLTLSGTGDKGYPMSQYLIKNNNYKLSYAALEVACHAIEKHCDKLKTSNYSDLKVHAYRAILEYLLIKKDSKLRHVQLKNTKVKEATTFREYCTSVTCNLPAEYHPSAKEVQQADIEDYLNQWKRVLAFGSLRLLLAPLVESLVLFDRFLYLTELGLPASLNAEFDCRVSPRNILLVSTKKNSDGRNANS